MILLRLLEKQTMPKTLMTIKELLQNNLLSNQTEVELILAHVLKKPREFILAHPEKIINKIQLKKYNRLINKRSQDIPMAYLTGHKEFFGVNFEVNKNVLIPRPDTELMVELVLTHITNHIPHNSKITLIDVGTGSGCIPISIIKTSKHKNIKTFAIDISHQALTIARKNARLNKTKIKFFQGNLLEPILCHPEFISGSFSKISSLIKQSNKKMLKPSISAGRQVQHGSDRLIIMANLPYLTQEQLKNEPSIKHEPKLALVAGRDGLKYYRQLLKQIKQNLFLIPSSLLLFLEIDPSQTSSIKKLIKKYLPKSKITIHKDLAGRNRVVEIIPLL